MRGACRSHSANWPEHPRSSQWTGHARQNSDFRRLRRAVRLLLDRSLRDEPVGNISGGGWGRQPKLHTQPFGIPYDLDGDSADRVVVTFAYFSWAPFADFFVDQVTDVAFCSALVTTALFSGTVAPFDVTCWGPWLT